MSPTFGDWFTGIYASEDNPHRHGMYVRTIRRTGRTNRGTHYELTDGHGSFFEYPVASVVPRSDAPVAEVIPVAVLREPSEALILAYVRSAFESGAARPSALQEAQARKDLSAVAAALLDEHTRKEPTTPANGSG
jgi:hypothetical protein